MARAGPRKTPRYSPEFKLTAVRLSQQPGIQVQAVAAALDIHPSRAGVWPAAGGARAPKKSHPVLFRTKAEKFGFIETQRGAVAVSRLWALYGVTRAGYYAWRSRPASARAVQDRTLSERLRALFAAHGGRYGSPRLHRELRRVGCGISRRRVERLMRMAGLRARVVQIYRANPGLHRFYGQHPNRLAAPVGAIRSGWAISRICGSVLAGASWRLSWTSTLGGCWPGD